MNETFNRYSLQIGNFNYQKALWGHIIYFKRQYKASADLLQKNGLYGLRGASPAMPDNHTLLKIKDKSQSLSEKQLQDLPQLKRSRFSEILTKRLHHVYHKYLTKDDVAYIDLVKIIDKTGLNGTEPIMVRLYRDTYELKDNKYLHEDFWFFRKPLFEYYADKDQHTQVVDDLDNLAGSTPNNTMQTTEKRVGGGTNNIAAVIANAGILQATPKINGVVPRAIPKGFTQEEYIAFAKAFNQFPKFLEFWLANQLNEGKVEKRANELHITCSIALMNSMENNFLNELQACTKAIGINRVFYIQ
jgi:hypothetical protein